MSVPTDDEYVSQSRDIVILKKLRATGLYGIADVCQETKDKLTVQLWDPEQERYVRWLATNGVQDMLLGDSPLQATFLGSNPGLI